MMSNYEHFLDGITIRGVPIHQLHPGEIFWVNNSSVLSKNGITGSDGNKGNYLQPFATIDYAVGKCTANRGDIIAVMPGHSETVSTATGGTAALDLDVAGICVVGLGQGTKVAQVDYTLAAGAVTVGASNISIVNMKFHANVPSVLVGIKITAAMTDTRISGCVFDVETTVTDAFVETITLGVGCNRTIVEKCKIDNGLQALSTFAILMKGATDGATFSNNRIVGDYSTACIGGNTTLSTEVYIIDNPVIMNGGAGNMGTVACVSMVTGSTGAFSDNHFYTNVAAAVTGAVVADTMLNGGNNWVATAVEVQPQLIDGGTNGVTRSATCVSKADETDGLGLFTVLGVIDVWGVKQVATTAANSASTIGIQLDATDPTFDGVWVTGTDLATETTIGDFAYAGSPGGGAFTIRQVETPTTGEQLWATPRRCPAGQIEQTAGGTAGALVSSYTIYWSEVSAGATCVAV